MYICTHLKYFIEFIEQIYIVVKKIILVISIVCSCQVISLAQCGTNSPCSIPSTTGSMNIDNRTNVTINEGEVVKIDNMNGSGTIINYGTLYLPNGIINRNIINYGTIIIAGGQPVVQNGSYIYNEQTGRICTIGNTSMHINNGSYIVNNGQFDIQGGLLFNSNSHLFNTDSGCMTVGRSVFINSNSSHCNSGSISVAGDINVTNGGSFSACPGFNPGGILINQNNNGNYSLSCINCIGPLGIKLVVFTASSTPEGNTIHWESLEDKDVDYYSLSHSTDGLNWEAIHNENSKGRKVNEYQYLHEGVLPETHYYQLSWTDADGHSIRSEIIFIANTDVKKQIVNEVNLLGQPVDNHHRGIAILQYSDGTTEKVYRN